MSENPAAQPRFLMGASVSAMRPVGQRRDGRFIWDLCCAGQIEQVEERDGAFYYAIRSPAPPHFHRQDEVAPRGTVDATVNRLNNEP